MIYLIPISTWIWRRSQKWLKLQKYERNIEHRRPEYNWHEFHTKFDENLVFYICEDGTLGMKSDLP
jgi:hypothetical protein